MPEVQFGNATMQHCNTLIKVGIHLPRVGSASQRLCHDMLMPKSSLLSPPGFSNECAAI